MPFESSTPLVVACLLGGAIALAAWVRTQAGWILAAAALLVAGGGGAFVADRLVVTDREYLVDLFPRLARAAERQDVATIMAALDPELRPLREEAERVLKQVRPTEVVITRCDVAIDTGRTPPTATVDLVVRVTGNVIDAGTPGTVLTGVKVTVCKKGDVWLVQDAEAVPIRPGGPDRPAPR